MKHRPLIVLADDLTGAAEIAAIAHSAGLRAVVHTSVPAGPVEADVIVCDTDSRLATPAKAAARVQSFTEKLNSWPHAGFFKKTDSVLRGNVLAEIEACMATLGLKRTLLVPCNPSLGRIIRDGQYLVSNVPLHKTNFVRDPHHPRRTSDVCKLVLGRKKSGVTTHVPTDRLPASGVAIGEADSPADVTLWAGRVDDTTLPAGGADFFRMWLLRNRRPHQKLALARLDAGEALLISGTAAVNDPITPLPGPLLAVEASHIESREKFFGEVLPPLKSGGFASVHTGGALVRTTGTPAALSRTFVRLALDLHEAKAFKHLIIAGGATAAAVLKALGWSEFRVLRAWGPGVVTLQPAAAPETTVTMKPGSYAWPTSLSDHFYSAVISSNV